MNWEQLPKPLRLDFAAAIRIAVVEEGAVVASGAVSTVIEFSAVIPLQSDRSGSEPILLFFHVSFARVNLWLNCQPGVLAWDLGHLFLWLLSCKFLWGAD